MYDSYLSTMERKHISLIEYFDTRRFVRDIISMKRRLAYDVYKDEMTQEVCNMSDIQHRARCLAVVQDSGPGSGGDTFSKKVRVRVKRIGIKDPRTWQNET